MQGFWRCTDALKRSVNTVMVRGAPRPAEQIRGPPNAPQGAQGGKPPAEPWRPQQLPQGHREDAADGAPVHHGRGGGGSSCCWLPEGETKAACRGVFPDVLLSQCCLTLHTVSYMKEDIQHCCLLWKWLATAFSLCSYSGHYSTAIRPTVIPDQLMLVAISERLVLLHAPGCRGCRHRKDRAQALETTQPCQGKLPSTALLQHIPNRTASQGPALPGSATCRHAHMPRVMNWSTMSIAIKVIKGVEVDSIRRTEV